MIKKIIRNPYVIAGVVVFFILLFVGVFGVGASWGESLFGSVALTVIGIGSIWVKQEIWPF